MANATDLLVTVLEKKHLPGRHNQKYHAGEHSATGTVEPVSSPKDKLVEERVRVGGKARRVSTPSRRAAKTLIGALQTAVPGGHNDITYSTGPGFNSFSAGPAVAIMTDGVCALVGSPGRGKSTMLNAAASAVLPPGSTQADINNATLQCTGDMSLAAIAGTRSLKGAFTAADIAKEPINPAKYLMAPIHLVEELNRTSSKFQNYLVMAMQNSSSKQGSSVMRLEDGGVVNFTPGPWLVAMNADEVDFKAGPGTSPLSPALLDRMDMLMLIPTDMVGSAELNARTSAGISVMSIMDKAKISPEQRAAMRKEIDEVYVPDEIHGTLDFVLNSVSTLPGFGSRSNVKKSAGMDGLKKTLLDLETVGGADWSKQPGVVLLADPSARLTQATVTMAKSLAFLRGSKRVDWEDVQNAWKFTAPHRLPTNRESGFYNDNPGAEQDQYVFANSLLGSLIKKYDLIGKGSRDTAVPADLNPFKLEPQDVSMLTADEVAGKLLDLRSRLNRHFGAQVGAARPKADFTKDYDKIAMQKAIDAWDNILDDLTSD